MSSEEKVQYIEIKNWEKYQADKDGRLIDGPSAWIKDWTNKESDYEYSQLTGFQRYIYDGLRRLRGQTGNNPRNDPKHIARRLCILPKEAHCIPQAIRKLTALLLVSLVESTDGNPKSRVRVDKNKNKSRVEYTPGAHSVYSTEDKEQESGEPTPVEPVQEKPNTAVFNPEAWHQEVGDSSAADVKRVIHYHWKVSDDVFWREATKTEAFFRRNFEKMASQVPADFVIPPPRYRQVADLQCSTCRGEGGYPVEQPETKYQAWKICECVKPVEIS